MAPETLVRVLRTLDISRAGWRWRTEPGSWVSLGCSGLGKVSSIPFRIQDVWPEYGVRFLAFEKIYKMKVGVRDIFDTCSSLA